ncbi:hypothetical protein [Pararhodobacter zhoushanensis]|uniref:Uncharacterized protein n=1 Tax=Pararhodobacter zhoushanensis TaxID=2479545 RepID=A0ABT3GVS0_9RHOB|nr:hypothetical protein [Pararhodobacter zhoushanensis]MCW1931625.1 hypothetical protein [Pararhodobacter zhoushanensis]
MLLRRKPRPPDPKARKRRWIERGVLAVIAVISLSWTAYWALEMARMPGLEPFVERTESQLAAAYERGLARAATPEAVLARLEARLGEEPRDWVVIGALQDLAAAQGGVLPAALADRIDVLDGADNGWIATGLDCAACAWDLRDCALSAALSCGVAVNVTVLGDLVALVREGRHYVAGDAVDQIDLGIAFVGIAATGLVVVSGGTSYTVKIGSGLLRVAHRMGRLAPEILGVFRRAVVFGVDWGGLRAVRSADGLAALARPAVIRPAVEVAQDLGRLNTRLGTRQALHLMGAIDTPGDAARIARASDVLGPRTVGALEMLGKSRFLRLGLRMSDEVLALVAGVFSVLMSGVALLAPLLGRLGRGGLRLGVRALLRLVIR